jgi:hypothetical protein
VPAVMKNKVGVPTVVDKGTRTVSVCTTVG